MIFLRSNITDNLKNTKKLTTYIQDGVLSFGELKKAFKCLGKRLPGILNKSYINRSSIIKGIGGTKKALPLKKSYPAKTLS